MPSHEGNEVSLEVEPTDTIVEADATETPPQPAPPVEPELPHPTLPGGLTSTPAVAASTSSDLQRLNLLIRNGLVPPSLVDCLFSQQHLKRKPKPLHQ